MARFTRLSLLAPALLSLTCACAGDDPVDNGTTGATTTTGAGGSPGTTQTATTTTSSGGGGGGTGGQGGAAQGGAGGSGGGAEPWPTCDTQPTGSVQKTIPEIWTDDPMFPTAAWVPGVYVTAVSGSGCSAGQSCQFFVQQNESYTTIADATHQSLRVGVAPAVASYFVGIAVGDQIDLFARASRDTQNGKNELAFLVTPSLPGCAKVVGTGDPQPITLTLDDFTVAAYETERGPMLVRVTTVTGNPNAPDATFALWDTGSVPGGDITTVTSLSPYFLSGGSFNGLTDGVNTDFDEVVGVFSLFTPPGSPVTKYEEICVRSDLDYPLAN